MSLLRYAQTKYRNCFAVLFACIALSACNSAPSKTVDPASESAHQGVTRGKNSGGPEIDLNCAMDRIQNPPESFHYSFKAESDNPWAEDADVTPQRIDGTFSNSSVSALQEFHGTPREASSNLMAIGRMTSIFATLRNTSAVVNEGEESVDGYSTVRYSIDTARGTASDQALFKSVLGPGGSEKGTVWVTSHGCPVRIMLNEELHAKDGSLLSKTRYKESMVKK